MPIQQNFYFCELFFDVPIFANQETSEKIPTKRLPLQNGILIKDIPSIGTLAGLLLFLC
jgi:hypothetical protein